MGQTTSQIDLYRSDNGFDHDGSGLEDLNQEEAMKNEQMDLYYSTTGLDYDDASLGDSSPEEDMSYNSSAKHSLRLWDTPPPKNMAASIKEVPSELPTPFIKGHEYGANLVAESITNGHTQSPIARQINRYIRKHPFFEKSLGSFTKSERRQFERDVYDYVRGSGLKKSEAKRHVVKAREFCGEEQSGSDSSSFEGEIDDSTWILESCWTLDESAAEAMAIDLPTCQVYDSDETRAALGSPINSHAASMSAGTKPLSKKRKAKAGYKSVDEILKPIKKLDTPTNGGEDAASMSAGTDHPLERRKARADPVDSDYVAAEQASFKLSTAPFDITDGGEDAASMSAGTNPTSKKRKAKADGTDSDCESDSALARQRMRKASRSYEGVLELSELSDKVVAQQAGDRLDRGKVARGGSKSESKRQKRLEIINDDEIKPGSDKKYPNEYANSHEPGTKDGGRRSEKKGRCPPPNTPSKPKAFIGQHDDQVIAEETVRPRKGRKRRRHRIDEMPADAILSSGDGNKENSTHHPRSRDTTSGETRAKLSVDFTHPMIQLA